MQVPQHILNFAFFSIVVWLRRPWFPKSLWISQSNCIIKDQANIDSNCQAADFKKASVNSEELDSVAINGHLICWELTGEPF